MTAIGVRPARTGDGDAIAALLLELGYDRNAADIDRDVETGLTGDVIVATISGGVVGVLAMKIHRQLHHGAHVASIESLVVAETARSAGVGKALLDAARDRARAAECILIELHSNMARTRARAFYERQGFTVTSNYFVRVLDRSEPP